MAAIAAGGGVIASERDVAGVRPFDAFDDGAAVSGVVGDDDVSSDDRTSSCGQLSRDEPVAFADSRGHALAVHLKPGPALREFAAGEKRNEGASQVAGALEDDR